MQIGNLYRVIHNGHREEHTTDIVVLVGFLHPQSYYIEAFKLIKGQRYHYNIKDLEVLCK